MGSGGVLGVGGGVFKGGGGLLLGTYRVVRGGEPGTTNTYCYPTSRQQAPAEV